MQLHAMGLLARSLTCSAHMPHCQKQSGSAQDSRLEANNECRRSPLTLLQGWFSIQSTASAICSNAHIKVYNSSSHLFLHSADCAFGCIVLNLLQLLLLGRPRLVKHSLSKSQRALTSKISFKQSLSSSKPYTLAVHNLFQA